MGEWFFHLMNQEKEGEKRKEKKVMSVSQFVGGNGPSLTMYDM